MNRGKAKLYLEKNHYATILLDEIKNMEQHGARWLIEMKPGNVWNDATNVVITYED